jgi:hypothetical protein
MTAIAVVIGTVRAWEGCWMSWKPPLGVLTGHHSRYFALGVRRLPWMARLARGDKMAGRSRRATNEIGQVHVGAAIADHDTISERQPSLNKRIRAR